VVIWWKAGTVLVEFIASECCLEPIEEVLDEALIELMQDVRGDRGVNVDKWKVFPEGMLDGLDSSIPTCILELKWPLVNLHERLKD
jgi:hypothetical protein